MVPRESLIDWLNSIEWLRPQGITPEAQALIDDHLVKARKVTKEIMKIKRLNAVEAYGFAQTAPHDTPEGDSLLQELFTKVVFRGAGVRESLITNITAAYCWNYVPKLCPMPNPWAPIIELYGMGYTTSGDDDPDGNGLTLLVGFKNGFNSYRII
jgi:hypothetical protein